MKGKKERILVVDDSPDYLDLLQKFLADDFNIVTAKNEEEANRKLSEKRFAAILLDIRLGKSSGIDLAKIYRELDKNMGIILISAYTDVFGFPGIEADDCLAKDIDPRLLKQAINKVIYNCRMPYKLRLRRFEMFKSLQPSRFAVRFHSRELHKEEGGEYEAINGICISDGRPIRWVGYNLLEHKKNIFNLGVACAIGCGYCLFCLSGKSKLIRPLTSDEMNAQVLIGFDSHLATHIFEPDNRIVPVVNMTCESDPIVNNVENVMRTNKTLASVEEMPINQIVTTIGHEQNLRIFKEECAHLHRLKIYWSVHTLNRGLREKLMPGTKGQSLENQKKILEEFAAINGNKVTIAWMLMPNINNSEDDVKSIVDFIGKGPFEVKVQPYEWTKGLPKYPQPSKAQLKSFCDQLIAKGVDCRTRSIPGTKFSSGCGTTVPMVKTVQRI